MSTAMEQLLLPRSIYEEMIAHARAAYPEEACGLLAGRPGLATALYRGRNVAADRHHDYVIDPQTLLRQISLAEKGEMLVGIYHSHPVSAPLPSVTDAALANDPDAMYLIVSLTDPSRPTVRGYRFSRGEEQQVTALPADAGAVRGGRDFAGRRMVTPRAIYFDLWRRDARGVLWQREVIGKAVRIVVARGPAAH